MMLHYWKHWGYILVVGKGCRRRRISWRRQYHHAGIYVCCFFAIFRASSFHVFDDHHRFILYINIGLLCGFSCCVCCLGWHLSCWLQEPLESKCKTSCFLRSNISRTAFHNKFSYLPVFSTLSTISFHSERAHGNKIFLLIFLIAKHCLANCFSLHSVVDTLICVHKFRNPYIRTSSNMNNSM